MHPPPPPPPPIPDACFDQQTAGSLSPTNSNMCIPGRGVAKIFQRGLHCVKQRVLTRFSCRPPRRVLLMGQKRLTEGESRARQDPTELCPRSDA